MSVGIASALVTGATGFIGSALVQRLARTGTRTTCLVRDGSARAGRIAAVPGLEVVKVPSVAASDLRAAHSGVRADVVFHLASYGVSPGERDPEQMIEGNVTLMARLLGAVAGRAVRRFIYTGSCSEYAPADEPLRIGEDYPIRPTSLYGAAKAAAQVYGGALARSLGVPFVTLRPFGVYGIGEADHRLVPHVIDHLRRGEVPSLTGGEQSRDFLYVDDVVEALIKAATAPGVEPQQVYNVCSGEPVRIRDVAERVASLLGKPGADLGLGRFPYRSDEAMWVVGDSQRFRAAADWKPRVSLTEGLRRVVAYSLAEARA